MAKVFLVQHSRDLDEGEDVKIIGVFSAEGLARAAVAELRAQKGFCDYPEGFSVDPYVLDRAYWEDGFVAVSGWDDEGG